MEPEPFMGHLRIDAGLSELLRQLFEFFFDEGDRLAGGGGIGTGTNRLILRRILACRDSRKGQVERVGHPAGGYHLTFRIPRFC